METIVTEVVSDQSLRDTRGRRIASQQRRAEVLAEYKTSGMTQKAFAKRAGVNIHTFVSWLADERRGASPSGEPAGPATPLRFVELGAGAGIAPRALFLEVAVTSHSLVVRRGGYLPKCRRKGWQGCDASVATTVPSVPSPFFIKMTPSEPSSAASAVDCWAGLLRALRCGLADETPPHPVC